MDFIISRISDKSVEDLATFHKDYTDEKCPDWHYKEHYITINTLEELMELYDKINTDLIVYKFDDKPAISILDDYL